MSSRELDERYEEEQNKRLAEHLGLTVDELDELSPDIDTNESKDGLVYNYVVNFHDGSSKALLSKVTGLAPGSLTMEVGLNVLDRDDDEAKEKRVRVILRRLSQLQHKLEDQGNTGADWSESRSLEDRIGSGQLTSGEAVERAETLLERYGF